jgi:hypothetical protein
MALLLLLLAGLLNLSPAAGSMPGRTDTGLPHITEEEGGILTKVLQDPAKYMGQEIVVEGVLNARGKGPYPTFFLCLPSGAGLEVQPWAPLELYHPPQGQPRSKSMAYFVGRKLRLSGWLVEQGGKIILQVSSAHEL